SLVNGWSAVLGLYKSVCTGCDTQLTAYCSSTAVNNNEFINYPVTEDGWYVIVVDSELFSSSLNTYTLNVSIGSYLEVCI
ncbi:MAG: hypothetical protein V2A73_18020, partial [Pseudomonadota bacterium]